MCLQFTSSPSTSPDPPPASKQFGHMAQSFRTQANLLLCLFFSLILTRCFYRRLQMWTSSTTIFLSTMKSGVTRLDNSFQLLHWGENSFLCSDVGEDLLIGFMKYSCHCPSVSCRQWWKKESEKVLAFKKNTLSRKRLLIKICFPALLAIVWLSGFVKNNRLLCTFYSNSLFKSLFEP